MKHLCSFGVVLALLSVMRTAPALAQDQVQPPQDYFDSLLQNYGSRLCLQPEQEAPINGVAIVQQPCNGKDMFQRWHFLAKRLDFQKPGIYWITNSGSGQCLDDRDGKTADSRPVGSDPLHPTPPWGRFINMRSGKCLDVRGGSSAPGAALQIYHCTSSGTLASGRANVAQVFEWLDRMPRPKPSLKR